ncbi:hypothetical protein TWF730_003432 [Orbilia blumenaviensis]|uniref:Pentatricopeptide repeat-containing protein n=1 Tax=Orbilia blumenaviensis TaxID=1796055 RepID=A0AAV9U809_9PEZI
MYAKVDRIRLSVSLNTPSSRIYLRHSATATVNISNRSDDGTLYRPAPNPPQDTPVRRLVAQKQKLKPTSYQEHKHKKPIQYHNYLKYHQDARLKYLSASHSRRLCVQLLSCGHSPGSVAARWCANSNKIQISTVGAYLASTGRDRVLLRILEGYLSAAAASQRWSLDRNASCKILIWCIENLHMQYRSKSISSESSKSRAERIVSLLIQTSRQVFGGRALPIGVGAYRTKFLLHLASPESAFRFYNSLLLSKCEIPERILLSILHSLENGGLFIQALQVFQKLALSPLQTENSLMIRTWQFRRLFLKLYRVGIPIHKSDIIGFFSSIGKVDPMIYKLLVYAAVGVNDANSVLRLTRDFEDQTGTTLPLDVMSAVFLMYHRLGDASKLKSTYDEAHRRSLQPLSDSFFVTAVMLVEAHKENANYWELCRVYGRFFKPLALNLLGLPLPIQHEAVPSPKILLEPMVGSLTIMLNSYLRTVAGNLEGSRYALTVYKKYIDLLQDRKYIPQFQTPSEHFIACIVSAVARYKPNLGLALGIVQDMIDFDSLPHPSSLTWDSLLRASTTHGDPDISERIWEAMLEHGIPPTTDTYSAMIMLYANIGDHEKVDILRSRLEQEGWTRTLHLQNALDFAERKRHN